MKGKMVVTGGAGFVGSHASEYFADRGWAVTALDNMSRGRMLGQSGIDTPKYNWDYLSKKKGITLVNTSVAEADRMDKLLCDADAVIHTAGQVAVTTSLVDPRKDFETNMLGTFNVLEACRKSGHNPAVIFCSTNKVYGENVNKLQVQLNGDRYEYADEAFKHGISESFSVDRCEHTPYGASKLAADLYVQEYSHTYGLKTAVFRMSCIYGTRQLGNEDQGWVAHFILSALRSKKITIYGDGRQVRDVLFVTDLIAAYSAFLESRLKCGVFNIGGGPKNTLSLLELIEHICNATGRMPEVSFDKWRNGDQKVYISDTSHAIQQLGWEPKVDVENGLRQLINWAAGV